MANDLVKAHKKKSRWVGYVKPQKFCKTCGESNQDNFYEAASRCKVCTIKAAAESKRKRKEADPEAFNKEMCRQAKDYVAKNRDKVLKQRKENREKNIDRYRGYEKKAYAKDGKERAAKRYKANPQRAVDIVMKSARKHAEKTKLRIQVWRENNKERMKEYSAKKYLENPEERRQRTKNWRRKNPGKSANLVAEARARKLKATPAWADKRKILEVYKEASQKTKDTGVYYSVDHVVPLAGKNVCGLHVHYNLRVILHSENIKKTNIWTP